MLLAIGKCLMLYRLCTNTLHKIVMQHTIDTTKRFEIFSMADVILNLMVVKVTRIDTSSLVTQDIRLDITIEQRFWYLCRIQ